jgi:outer membrane cobalamin receptor
MKITAMLFPALTVLFFGLTHGDIITGDDLPVYYLEEMVVTANRYPRLLKDISATVSIVTESDIEKLNMRNSTDILATLPGIFVNKTGDFGRADIDIRGIGDRGRSVMVMIDGRPVKMGLYGCTVTHSLPMDNVERIEVVRGPASVLYGSDALGGVINIITKSPQHDFEGDVLASYGNFETYQYRLRAGGKMDRLQFYGTGDYRSSDGYSDNSAYEGKDITGFMGYDINEHIKLNVNVKYFIGYKEEPLRITDPDTIPSNVWNEYERGAVDLTVNSKIKTWQTMFKIYRNQGEHEFSDGWHSKDFTNGVMLQSNIALLTGNELSIGADFRQQGGERPGIDSVPWEKNEYGIFFHDEQVVFGIMILSCGARYNHDDKAGDAISPQVGCVIQPVDGTIIRGAINRGFRSPQINELFLFPSSNADLEPEIVCNYEIGLNQRIMNGLNIEATGFIMEGENIIQTVPNQTPPPLFRFENVGTFQFKGAEFGIIARYKDLMTARIYHSYLDPGEKTTGRPKNKTDIVMALDYSSLGIGLNGQYVTDYFAADSSQNPIDAYLIIDSKISYALPFGLHPYIAVDNILDQNYSTYVNLPSGSAGLYQMAGRNYTVGFNYKF